ncbi:hypothetical protein RND81_09G069500 [Saponaria officinalis]|uniref:Uncharacterized protein n=1 Tax=Saponaria officinalis TaxID=3572 RepID=A0AAW1IHK6_SAPOF
MFVNIDFVSVCVVCLTVENTCIHSSFLVINLLAIKGFVQFVYQLWRGLYQVRCCETFLTYLLLVSHLKYVIFFDFRFFEISTWLRFNNCQCCLISIVASAAFMHPYSYSSCGGKERSFSFSFVSICRHSLTF